MNNFTTDFVNFKDQRYCDWANGILVKLQDTTKVDEIGYELEQMGRYFDFKVSYCRKHQELEPDYKRCEDYFEPPY